jgi:dTDP-4-amino-4,6-dideoxygalactose transaminase
VISETTPRIPVLDLTPEIEMLWDDLMEAVQRVLRSGRFILGPEVEAFESEVAAYLGAKHAVGVNSGTDALVISLRALGIGPGDEVITTPFTFFATPESISNVGATPVFVDIDERTFNIDPALIEPAITERTKAIVPVHLYGQSCDMDPIMDIARRHELRVIEDVAQAMGGAYKGRKLGTIGDAAAFSFFPSKNLGGFGDGGMVMTDDDEVAEVARMLRTHGAKRKYENEMLGYNSRLDELQAAMLRVKLRHLDELNDGRRAVASRYDELLADVPGVTTPYVAPGVHHVYHQYTVRIADGRRDVVAKQLDEAGVQTMIYYPVPSDALPAYGDTSPIRASVAASQVLSLPMGLSFALPRRVAGCFR